MAYVIRTMSDEKFPHALLDRTVYPKDPSDFIYARIYGSSPCPHGVASIVLAIHSHSLENRVDAVNEFVERGWV